ncbi:MAG: tripartite tricarboxylate transporter permease, partial [Hyphomicrobiaceae bacterium]
QTGTLRWTLDSLYLWEGLPLVPLTLGIFALPELCDLAIGRGAIMDAGIELKATGGLMNGVRDCLCNWFLVLRCSWIGSILGAVPGIGASVIDWISYGHALRTEKGAQATFGKGDVRGVIAAESATNSREGGALVPTVVFGVPGSAGMAILLGAFLIHGLVPGPEMLTKHLTITYSMVWSIAVANILGSGLCFLFSGQFAKLATLRFTLIMPCVLSLIYIGAFEGSRNWGDLYSLLTFGLIGWGMKHLKFPRPPLVLGFILGSILERYLFISIERFGIDWMWRPAVIVLMGMGLLSILRPALQDIRAHGGMKGMASGFTRPHFTLGMLFPIGLLVLFSCMMWEASGWNFKARVVPTIIGTGAILFCSLSLLNQMFRRPDDVDGNGHAGQAASELSEKMHMDIGTSLGHLPLGLKLKRGGIFFAWMLSFMASMALIGLIPTVPIFIVTYMRLEGREPWRIVLPMALVMTGLIYGLFDQLLTIPWPPSYLGDLFPALKVIPSV